MKKRILMLFIMCSLMLTGCHSKMDEKEGPDVNRVSLKNLPVCEIECVKNGSVELQFPDMEIITETKGELLDYMVYDEYAYLLIAYDFNYYYYYSQVALYRMNLNNEKIDLIAYDLYDEGVIAGLIRYEDGVVWNEVTEQGKWYKCTIKDGIITKEPSENMFELHDQTSSDEWKNNIQDKYLTDKVELVGESENYIVWEQWKEPEYPFKDTYINILDKKTNKVTQYCKDEFGIVHTPVFLNDMVAFLTIDDIKSYKSNEEFYENVYIINLSTMEYSRITDNYGNEYTPDTIIYDEPRANGEHICFYSRIIADGKLEYEYLYYID